MRINVRYHVKLQSLAYKVLEFIFLYDDNDYKSDANKTLTTGDSSLPGQCSLMTGLEMATHVQIAPYCLAVLLHKHTLSHTFQVWRCIGLQGMPLKGSGMQWKVSNDQIREAAHVEIDCPYNGSTLVAIKGVSTQYKYFLPRFQQDTTSMKMGRNT